MSIHFVVNPLRLIPIDPDRQTDGGILANTHHPSTEVLVEAQRRLHNRQTGKTNCGSCLSLTVSGGGGERRDSQTFDRTNEMFTGAGLELGEAAAGDVEREIANLRAFVDAHTANDVVTEVGVGVLQGRAEGAVFVGERAVRIEFGGDDGVAFGQRGVDVGFGFVSGNSRLEPVEQVCARRDEREVRRSCGGERGLLVGGKGHDQFLQVWLDIFRWRSQIVA
jgi:hypothetical protein